MYQDLAEQQRAWQGRNEADGGNTTAMQGDESGQFSRLEHA